MRQLLALGLALLPGAAALAAQAGGAGRPVIDNWAELRAVFVRCWRVPKGTEGSQIAFQFLLAPDGGMRGPPRLVGRVLAGEPEARRRFEAAAYAPFQNCLPVTLTPGFKAVLGESLIHLRFVNRPREPARNLGAAMTIFAEEAVTEAE